MQFVFNRVEKKYMVDAKTCMQIQERIKERMNLDEHGTYTLCNIYYDTDDSELIRTSLEKPAYKEKLRIRSYNTPTQDTKVFLEIKKKYAGIVNKRRIQIDLQSAYDYVEKGIMPKEDSQVVHELDYFIHHYPLKRAMYISYDRIAYQDKEDKNFRITFDTHLISRDYDLALEKGIYGNEILDDNHYILEVKTGGAIPLWFTHILSELKVYPTSFSKYGSIYKQKILKGA